jgi:hypothetical protein
MTPFEAVLSCRRGLRDLDYRLSSRPESLFPRPKPRLPEGDGLLPRDVPSSLF